jgi:hypothetical protein
MKKQVQDLIKSPLTKEPRQIRKLTIHITDEAALAAAYPQVMETVTTQVPNRQLLREIVKACAVLGHVVPGVDAFFAFEREEEAAANQKNTA